MKAGIKMREVSRRFMLRGLGGALLAAPFLGSLAHRSKAKAAGIEVPKRLIVMYTHGGHITNRFFPKKAHGELTAADLEGTTLKHLAPFVGQLLIPRGIRANNEWTSKLLRGQGNDPHAQAAGSYFTCQPLTPNSNEPFSLETMTKFTPRPMGPSLDHVMSKQISAGGTPLLMNVSGGRDSAQSAISYSASETLFPGQTSASQVFSQLTNIFDGPLSSPTYQAARDRNILDLVKDDLATLERQNMSKHDRLKLAAWKELVDSTGKAISSAACNAEVAASLGLTAETIAEASKSSGVGRDRLTTQITSDMDTADLYSNLAVLAALCNANPVIFLKYPFAYVYTGLGITQDLESLNHRLGNANLTGTCVADALDNLLKIDDYHTRKFAYLVRRLSEVTEGDGTLLDNTAAVWFSQFSDGLAHNLNNLPIIQAGSAGGYFKTGCAINVEDGSPSLSNGNSEAFCSEAGPFTVDGIGQLSGTDPNVARAPINKYFCNLMNALGVKAGPDGFPIPGGSAVVTHFGRYDRSEDFVGGSVNPPMIHDPGEFAQLRA